MSERINANIDFSSCAWWRHAREREAQEKKCEQLLTLACHAWALYLNCEPVLRAKWRALHDKLYPQGVQVVAPVVADTGWTADAEPVLI